MMPQEITINQRLYVTGLSNVIDSEEQLDGPV
jgi:hypothetical protein